MFKYDRVFGMDSTQEAVYEDTKALIRSVLDGKRCTQYLRSRFSQLQITEDV